MALKRFPSLTACVAAFGSVRGTALRNEYEVLRRDGELEPPKFRLFYVMRRFDEILGTHGVESIEKGHNSKSPYIDYCNTGDPYTTTLMLVGGKSWRIGSWGDIVERGNYD